MPNKDGTGPKGKGPKTGRGLGNCDPKKSSDEEKFSEKGLGRKHRQGRGQGEGRNR